MKVKILRESVGVCPYCESENIEYSSLEHKDVYVYYPCTCKNCNRYFEEWYTLTFAGMNVGEQGQYQAEDYDEIEYDFHPCGNCAEYPDCTKDFKECEYAELGGNKND